MKIIHLCESDTGGGAARAAYRMHSALHHLGVDSSMVVGQKGGADPRVTSVIRPLQKRIHQRLDRLPRGLLRTSNASHVSPAWIGSQAWVAANAAQPSLVHLHWICKGFLRIEHLSRLAAPLVWSLHDMWPFAGGEHYVGDCTRYRDGYRAHNRPDHESGFDLNRWVWMRKCRAWSAVRHLTLFPVSHWLAARARESVLFRDRPIEVVHNAIDEQEFKPHDHGLARTELGLPMDRPLVLFGALNATKDARKGFDLLTAALRHLRGSSLPLELVVFGDEPSPGEPMADLGFKAHYLGAISDPARLALVYAACDVMVVPSREEAFGQTALEALACGTPVVAFRVGGLPELIEHEVCGYLARPFEVSDLAAGIHYILEAAHTAHWRQLSEAGRATIERSFTLALQARRCRTLYEQALERSTLPFAARPTRATPTPMAIPSSS